MQILTVLLVLLASSLGYAQESSRLDKVALRDSIDHVDIYEVEKEVNGKVAPSMNIEILGKTPFTAGVNYEHNFNKNLGIGIGLGFGRIQRGEITRNTNYGQPDNMIETGRYLDAVGSVPVYLIARQGNGKHHIIEQLGVTTMVQGYFNSYPSGNDNSMNALALPFASIGYEFQGKRTYFRVPIYLGYLGDNSGWFPKFMPWAGVTIGIKLNKSRR